MTETSPAYAAPRRFDSHVHAWRRWPYAHDVADPFTRAGIQTLLEQLDANDVARALIVCADIEYPENDQNHLLAQDAFTAHPGRFEFVADLDSTWKETHHTAGAVERLERILAEAPDAAGITHYVAGENDGWFRSPDAGALFDRLATRGLIASISASSQWLPDLYALASDFPTVPVLLHHQGWIETDSAEGSAQLDVVCAGAATASVVVKASGFHYLTSRPWDYPFRGAHGAFREILDSYGPERLAWGSDFPASFGKTTYGQSLHVLEEALPEAPQHVFDAIVGGTLNRILPFRSPTIHHAQPERHYR